MRITGSVPRSALGSGPCRRRSGLSALVVSLPFLPTVSSHGQSGAVTGSVEPCTVEGSEGSVLGQMCPPPTRCFLSTGDAASDLLSVSALITAHCGSFSAFPFLNFQLTSFLLPGEGLGDVGRASYQLHIHGALQSGVGGVDQSVPGVTEA